MKHTLKNLAVLLFTFISVNVIGQILNPKFQMPIYFEDGIGNKDTIIVGYDPSVQNSNLNPQFGEVWINKPFDSIFEVRAMHFDEQEQKTSKKVIAGTENAQGDTCGSGDGIKIMFNIVHFPIKVKYDTTLVHSSACHTNLILSPSWGIYLQQYWWNAEVYYCMSMVNAIVDSANYITNPKKYGAGYLNYEFEVEGQGLIKLPGYFWVMKWKGICQNLVETNDPHPSKIIEGMVVPNPSSDEISVQLNEDTPVQRIQFYDLMGRCVKTVQPISQLALTHLQVNDLHQGIYFIHMYTFDNPAPLVIKFVIP
jgi:hypothetical protein